MTPYTALLGTTAHATPLPFGSSLALAHGFHMISGYKSPSHGIADHDSSDTTGSCTPCTYGLYTCMYTYNTIL